jgi:hypothetical protein
VAFDPPTYLSAGDGPVSVATGDFNGDDDPDLAVANRFSSDVSVLLGGAGGGFSGPTSFPTDFFSNSVAIGDFNLSAALVSGLTHGSLTLNPNGSFTYTPAGPAGGTTTRARST